MQKSVSEIKKYINYEQKETHKVKIHRSGSGIKASVISGIAAGTYQNSYINN